MTPQDPEALRVALLVVEALDRLELPYHLGGSYASSIHGIPRQSHDVDLVVDLDTQRVSQLAARLERDFYLDTESIYDAVARRSSFNLVHFATGIKVDVFVKAAGPFDQAEFARQQLMALVSDPRREIFVKSPEDTLLRKLLWYRAGGEVSDRQWTDVLGIIKIQGGRLDLPYLRLWSHRLGVDDLLARALSEQPHGQR